MQNLIAGFCGWIKMQDTKNESLKLVDTALTVVATLMIATTWAMLRG